MTRLAFSSLAWSSSHKYLVFHNPQPHHLFISSQLSFSKHTQQQHPQPQPGVSYLLVLFYLTWVTYWDSPIFTSLKTERHYWDSSHNGSQQCLGGSPGLQQSLDNPVPGTNPAVCSADSGEQRWVECPSKPSYNQRNQRCYHGANSYSFLDHSW